MAASTASGLLLDAGLPRAQKTRDVCPTKPGLEQKAQEWLCLDRSRGAYNGSSLLPLWLLLNFATVALFFFSLIKFDCLKFGCSAQHVGS